MPPSRTGTWPCALAFPSRGSSPPLLSEVASLAASVATRPHAHKGPRLASCSAVPVLELWMFEKGVLCAGFARDPAGHTASPAGGALTSAGPGGRGAQQQCSQVCGLVQSRQVGPRPPARSMPGHPAWWKDPRPGTRPIPLLHPPWGLWALGASVTYLSYGRTASLSVLKCGY